jgi:hypothetical protein
MLLVEQKLLIFPGNLSSILVFSWALYWGKNSKKKKTATKKEKETYKNKTLLSLVAIECLLFNPKMSNFSAISRREQVTFNGLITISALY